MKDAPIRILNSDEDNKTEMEGVHGMQVSTMKSAAVNMPVVEIQDMAKEVHNSIWLIYSVFYFPPL